MKNRLFIAAEDAVNRRKLDVTLRRFTSDRLTEEQRQIIEMAVGYQRQCCISVCPTVQKFRQVMALQETDPKRTSMQMLFGSPDSIPGEPAAALIYRRRFPETSNTVYLYIP